MENKKTNPVGWFEIYVDDMARAVKFYNEILQVEITKMPTPEGMDLEMMSFPMEMTREGAAGALVRMDGYGPSGSGTIVYFIADDCGAVESRIVAAGGTVIKSKESIGEYGFMTIASDTEGNTIGFHSMK
jgi:uncharacterized protein